MFNPTVKILAFYDYTGRAWWHRLHNIRRFLPSHIVLDIKEVYESFNCGSYDYFLLLEAYLLPLIQFLPPQQIIAGSSCARIADNAAQALAKQKCRALVFNSMEMYASAGGLPAMYCCQNGVDEELFVPAADCPQEFTACWIGNSNSIGKKGLEIIQVACAQTGVRLLFRDESREKTPLPHAKVRDNYYRQSSVYICASMWEGTPNPALEALSCGVPVISTPVGNMPELLRDGYNGFLVKRDAASIAAALRKIRDMDQQTLAVNARQSILDGWTWKQQTQKYAAMFQALAREDRLGECQRETAPHGYLQHMFRSGCKSLASGHALDAAERLSWAVRYTPFFRAIRHLKICMKK